MIINIFQFPVVFLGIPDIKTVCLPYRSADHKAQGQAGKNIISSCS